MVSSQFQPALRFAGVTTLLAVLLSGATLLSAPLDLKDLDNTIFDRLAAKASETVNVTLSHDTLKLAAGFLGSGDQDARKLRDLVNRLTSVTVRSFEFKKSGEYSASDLKEIRTNIVAPEWSRIVDVHNKDNGENTEIYILPGKDKPQGLLILSAEPQELTVVHIVGPIDLSDLSSLQGLGVPNVSGGKSFKGEK